MMNTSENIVEIGENAGVFSKHNFQCLRQSVLLSANALNSDKSNIVHIAKNFSLHRFLTNTSVIFLDNKPNIKSVSFYSLCITPLSQDAESKNEPSQETGCGQMANLNSLATCRPPSHSIVPSLK